MNAFPTYNPRIDEKILLNMEYDDLREVCLSNKYVNSICNQQIFWYNYWKSKNYFDDEFESDFMYNRMVFPKSFLFFGTNDSGKEFYLSELQRKNVVTTNLNDGIFTYDFRLQEFKIKIDNYPQVISPYRALPKKRRLGTKMISCEAWFIFVDVKNSWLRYLNIINGFCLDVGVRPKPVRLCITPEILKSKDFNISELRRCIDNRVYNLNENSLVLINYENLYLPFKDFLN